MGARPIRKAALRLLLILFLTDDALHGVDPWAVSLVIFVIVVILSVAESINRDVNFNLLGIGSFRQCLQWVLQARQPHSLQSVVIVVRSGAPCRHRLLYSLRVKRHISSVRNPSDALVLRRHHGVLVCSSL